MRTLKYISYINMLLISLLWSFRDTNHSHIKCYTALVSLWIKLATRDFNLHMNLQCNVTPNFWSEFRKNNVLGKFSNSISSQMSEDFLVELQFYSYGELYFLNLQSHFHHHSAHFTLPFKIHWTTSIKSLNGTLWGLNYCRINSLRADYTFLNFI